MKRQTLWRTIAVLGLIGFVVTIIALSSLTLGDGRCSGSDAIATFEITESNSTQGRSIQILYRGGEKLDTTQIFIATNNHTWSWSELVSSESDTVIDAGDTVSVTISSEATVDILYQRPPPSNRLNPFEEPCYKERNQTLQTYTQTPEPPTPRSDVT